MSPPRIRKGDKKGGTWGGQGQHLCAHSQELVDDFGRTTERCRLLFADYGSRFRVQGSGFRAEGVVFLGFGVWGLGLEFMGSGFRV